MLGRALGRAHSVAVTVAVAVAAPELPANLAHTMTRWMASCEADRSPLAIRSPVTPTTLYASAAARAGVLDRSGHSVSKMSVGSAEAPQPLGLSSAFSALSWRQIRSHANEAGLPLFGSMAAGSPQSLCEI